MKRLKEERLARAKRVQAAREMTKLSRREFAKKSGIANTTLQHWEDGEKHTLPEKSVRRFIKALLNLGVHCSYDWLMHGKGPAPQYAGHVIFQEETTDLPTHGARQKNEDEEIKEELTLFLSRNKNTVHLVVSDDAMEPRFVQGEVVAGVRVYGKEIEKLIGLDCIVLVQGGDLLLRTILKGDVEGYYHLGYTNPKTTASKPFLYNIELVNAAPVILARRNSHLYKSPK
ncbi:transcriptional regulator [Coxiella burnetii 'MSU Goat Q177']|nr:transcriptional regulator [Coxiella burnetii 'MSU Goat Q177']